MKSKRLLLEKIKKLNKENKKLTKQLLIAEGSIDALRAGNVDALVVAHKKGLKIYIEQKADKPYRTLIEKMHEGAVTLNKAGTILYSNSSFANMVRLPLQKVIGRKFRSFIDAASKRPFMDLLKKGWQGYAQDEIRICTDKGAGIRVLMSVKSLSLENSLVLSIILTDLTLQNKMTILKSELIEKIINVITEMNLADALPKMNYSEYISRKLNLNYTYLSNIFSEVKGITIKQFIQVHKIEIVKELLLYGELNLSQISYKLHYSSVSHLSNQFKNVTGFSPTVYKQMKADNYGENIL